MVGQSAERCHSCPYVNQAIDKARIAEGEVYTRSKTYGEHLKISVKADPTDLEDNKRVAKALLESFPEMKIKIRPHIRVKGHKNPELEIDGLIADNKKIQGWGGISNGFKSAIKQGCKAVVIDLDAHIKRLDIEKVSKGIADRKKDFKEGIIKVCYVVLDNQAVEIMTHDRNEVRAILQQLKKKG